MHESKDKAKRQKGKRAKRQKGKRAKGQKGTRAKANRGGKVQKGKCKVLNKKGYKELKKTHNTYVVVEMLEQIADNYRDICMYMSQKKKIGSETLEHFEQINDFLDDLFKLYYKFDTKQLKKFKNKRVELMDKAKKLIEKESPLVNCHLYSIMERIQHIEISLMF